MPRVFEYKSDFDENGLIYKLGLIATGTSSEELARIQARDFDLWGGIVKASGFKPEN